MRGDSHFDRRIKELTRDAIRDSLAEIEREFLKQFGTKP
jgi:hypothetical protein